MYGVEPLSNEKVIHAVGSMTYSGLQQTAACFLMMANKQGFTPEKIMKILEGEG
jgi:hypothetical protein